MPLRTYETYYLDYLFSNRKFTAVFLIVLDGGYNVPPGYAGRVLMGMGPGPYLGTHAKPVTREYL